MKLYYETVRGTDAPYVMVRSEDDFICERMFAWQGYNICKINYAEKEIMFFAMLNSLKMDTFYLIWFLLNFGAESSIYPDFLVNAKTDKLGIAFALDAKKTSTNWTITKEH